MAKISISPKPLIYPTPAVLVGAAVAGKPNFMTVAWCGVVNSIPPMVSVSLQHQRHTLVGIRKHRTFSVNIPSADMVKETDYCGIVSGAMADKSADCGFKVFSGQLKCAPMIDQCPVNLACNVVRMLDLGSHAMVLGQVIETYVTESCLTGGLPDADKMKPLLWAMGAGSEYRAFGKSLGAGFSAGKQVKVRGK
jgi:flavin reductase (DIM6/NTAB) family NADH-FMN oxidoreductase RutF